MPQQRCYGESKPSILLRRGDDGYETYGIRSAYHSSPLESESDSESGKCQLPPLMMFPPLCSERGQWLRTDALIVAEFFAID